MRRDDDCAPVRLVQQCRPYQGVTFQGKRGRQLPRHFPLPVFRCTAMNNAKRNAGFVQTTEIRRAGSILGDANLEQWMALLCGGECCLPRCWLCEAGDLRGHDKVLGAGLVAQPEIMLARSENAKRIFGRFFQHLILHSTIPTAAAADQPDGARSVPAPACLQPIRKVRTRHVHRLAPHRFSDCR
jgi:hypothetical protein